MVSNIFREYSTHPNREILDTNIIQLLGDARGPNHVHQLVLVEPNLLQICCSKVGGANNFLQVTPKSQLVHLSFVLFPMFGTIVGNIKYSLSKFTKSLNHVR